MKTSSSPNLSAPVTPDVAADLREAIRCRAEEIYIRNGRIPGRDVENWAQAEQEIRRETAVSESVHRRAIVVKVNGVQYVGEYAQEAADGYLPGEFGSGASVTVRFEGDRMFVKRHNGKELETTVVRKVG